MFAVHRAVLLLLLFLRRLVFCRHRLAFRGPTVLDRPVDRLRNNRVPKRWWLRWAAMTSVPMVRRGSANPPTHPTNQPTGTRLPRIKGTPTACGRMRGSRVSSRPFVLIGRWLDASGRYVLALWHRSGICEGIGRGPYGCKLSEDRLLEISPGWFRNAVAVRGDPVQDDAGSKVVAGGLFGIAVFHRFCMSLFWCVVPHNLLVLHDETCLGQTLFFVVEVSQ